MENGDIGRFTGQVGLGQEGRKRLTTRGANMISGKEGKEKCPSRKGESRCKCPSTRRKKEGYDISRFGVVGPQLERTRRPPSAGEIW